MPSLPELREQIDDLDHKLIALLAERAAVVEQIGHLKNTDEEIVASDRQAQVYATRRAWAAEAGLDPALAEAVYRAMIAYFIEQERQQLAARSKHD